MSIDPFSLIEKFRALFGREPELYRAPGRVNLIGEHTDYNDGFVLPMNTSLFTWVAIRSRPDRLVRIHSVLFNESCDFDLEGITPGGQPAWLEYARGVASVLQAEGFELGGADILIDGEIPLGGGLSSSASLETALAVAMLGCAGLKADPMHLALMCQRAEHEFAGVPCGIMDQAVISSCPQYHAIKLDCRSLDYQAISLPDELCMLVVDSGVKHKLSDGGYRQRRQQCESALAVLARHDPSIKGLRDATAEQVERLRGEMGDLPYRRARHVVSENERVHQAEKAIATGDLLALGAILDASHASLRDDFMVSCAETDFLAQSASECPGVYGARMVGGGFGGCTITLLDREVLEQTLGHIIHAYTKFSGQAPWHHLVRSAAPAGRAEII